jgi:hypothetical protein
VGGGAVGARYKIDQSPESVYDNRPKYEEGDEAEDGEEVGQ